MEKRIEKYAIVRETAAAQFEETLNETLFALRDSSPVVEFDSVGGDMIARIRYQEAIETVTPTKAEAGIKFTCEDCPHFRRATNVDGSVDQRKKWGDCPFSLLERTTKNAAACEVLYNQIANGEIVLVKQ